jgi:hypothetical protein
MSPKLPFPTKLELTCEPKGCVMAVDMSTSNKLGCVGHHKRLVILSDCNERSVHKSEKMKSMIG